MRIAIFLALSSEQNTGAQCGTRIRHIGTQIPLRDHLLRLLQQAVCELLRPDFFQIGDVVRCRRIKFIVLDSGKLCSADGGSKLREQLKTPVGAIGHIHLKTVFRLIAALHRIF